MYSLKNIVRLAVILKHDPHLYGSKLSFFKDLFFFHSSIVNYLCLLHANYILCIFGCAIVLHGKLSKFTD